MKKLTYKYYNLIKENPKTNVDRLKKRIIDEFTHLLVTVKNK